MSRDRISQSCRYGRSQQCFKYIAKKQKLNQYEDNMKIKSTQNCLIDVSLLNALIINAGLITIDFDIAILSRNAPTKPHFFQLLFSFYLFAYLTIIHILQV